MPSNAFCRLSILSRRMSVSSSFRLCCAISSIEVLLICCESWIPFAAVLPAKSVGRCGRRSRAAEMLDALEGKVVARDKATAIVDPKERRKKEKERKQKAFVRNPGLATDLILAAFDSMCCVVGDSLLCGYSSDGLVQAAGLLP